MKRFHVFILLTFLVFANGSAFAQDKEYFAGKWDIKVDRPPNGTTMLIEITVKDGTVAAKLLDQQTSKEIAQFTDIQVVKDSITMYITIGGFDAYLYLEKLSDDSLTGSLMDMFKASGQRHKK